MNYSWHLCNRVHLYLIGITTFLLQVSSTTNESIYQPSSSNSQIAYKIIIKHQKKKNFHTEKKVSNSSIFTKLLIFKYEYLKIYYFIWLETKTELLGSWPSIALNGRYYKLVSFVDKANEGQRLLWKMSPFGGCFVSQCPHYICLSTCNLQCNLFYSLSLLICRLSLDRSVGVMHIKR